MSAADPLLDELAQWARKQKVTQYRGPFKIMDIKDFENYTKLKQMYPYRNIQVVRAFGHDTITADGGPVKLVALFTSSECRVKEKPVKIGQEITISPGERVSITPEGEFLLLET